jgi:Tfp pilus assembly protein PilO
MGVELIVGLVIVAVVVIGIALGDKLDKQPTVDALEEKVDNNISEKKKSYGNLNSKTKTKLEEIGRELGIELDRRKTKANMIAELEEFIKTKK